MSQRKVYLDTDIGTDSDDAVALAYLLCQKQCDLVGVSTVGMDSGVRARLVDAICGHMDHPDVPVVAGADRPLFPSPYWTDHPVDQRTILDDWPSSRSYTPNQAIASMREAIRSDPGEVALLTLGPLTNAALLAATDPETFARLDSVWVMGGTFDYDPDDPSNDCNMILDPVAAGSFFHASYGIDDETVRASFPPVYVDSVGAGRGLALTGEEATEALAGEHLAPVRACCEHRNRLIDVTGQGMHDPFAAMLPLRDDLCEFERGRIGVTLRDHGLGRGVEFKGDERTGITHFEADQNGPHRLARNPDREKVVEHLTSVLQKRGE